MTWVMPHYYADFRCIADRCRHSCCVGWDIVADDDTAAFYRTVEGEFGDRLRANLRIDDDGDSVFTMTADGRCPFLNSRGLCDIILTLGESALCQICDDHPRFYNTFSDRTEIGLGLCCEAAASLILSQTQPFSLVIAEGGNERLSAEECAFFAFREKLFDIVQNRSLSLPERENALLNAVGIHRPPFDTATLWTIYHQAERLDESWTAILDTLQEAPSSNIDSLDIMREQLLVYFLYRHTADALDDGRHAARVAFAVYSECLLAELAKRTDGSPQAFIELARQYSAEIEYSDRNPSMLMDYFETNTL